MKQKVINVSYRKDSNKFEDWMKYEIEILNEDGSKELIPAYGKDLQDALSRVVHDKKVNKVQKTAEKFPWWGWAVIWFIYILGLATITKYVNDAGDSGWMFGIGMIIPVVIVTLLNRWSIEQNKDKIERKNKHNKK